MRFKRSSLKGEVKVINMKNRESKTSFWELEIYKILAPFLMGIITLQWSLLDFKPWQKNVFFILGIIIFILAFIILFSTLYKRKVRIKSNEKKDTPIELGPRF